MLSYTVRYDVLKSDYDKWNKECSSQERVNTTKCKVRFYETDILYDIVKDLVQNAYADATGTNVANNRKKISTLVGRYE